MNKLFNFLREIRDRQKISVALTKGALMKQSRNIELTDPTSWEFSGFSQNGEDGILDVLCHQLLNQNRYFVEIGFSDGMENNTSWLLVAEKYNGLCIDGNKKLIERADRSIMGYSIGAECHSLFVTKETVRELINLTQHDDPDVFSLDIDGNDYFIAQAIMEQGLRPKIFVVEYNSVYGPERSTSIAYKENFAFKNEHQSHLYYGVSIEGWKHFFRKYNYKFITVERNGVNAFFVDPNCFNKDFLQSINGLSFKENQAQYKRFKCSYLEQFALIKDEKFVDISSID